MQRGTFLLAILIVFVLIIESISSPAEARAQGPVWYPDSGADGPYLHGDDTPPDLPRPANTVSGQDATAAEYRVIPIYFVPRDITPNPYALRSIDRTMQSVRRWYAEQLGDRTFRLDPAILFNGSYQRSYYYGSCAPITASCYLEYQNRANYYGDKLWTSIFDDLSNHGYPGAGNQVLGVFFQDDGYGATALGNPGKFLTELAPVNIIGDCLSVGCGKNVDEGGIAHELGHAFGLPHTADDTQSSTERSIMYRGFYHYPQCGLIDNATNPEIGQLDESPFFSEALVLQDGGFERCLNRWNVTLGSVECTATGQRTGFSGLLIPGGQAAVVSQDVKVSAGQVYDFTGWFKSFPASDDISLQFEVTALSSAGTALQEFSSRNYPDVPIDWKHFGLSMRMPSGAQKARIAVSAVLGSPALYFDDFEFRPAEAPPEAPLPVFSYDGDEVTTLKPVIRWSDVTEATSYRLQIAEDPEFHQIVSDNGMGSPVYTVVESLLEDHRYFWRVRAVNGAGEGSWSDPWSFVARPAERLLSDEFEVASLDPAWSWIRENNLYWRFGGPAYRRDEGYLGIITQPGDLLEGSNDARNLLLRPAPAGNFSVSTTYDVYYPVGENDQQGGLVVYQDDDNYLKLVRLYHEWNRLTLLAEIDGKVAFEYRIPIVDNLPIRLTRVGNTYMAYFSPDGVSWRKVGQPVQIDLRNAKIGLVAFNKTVEARPVTFDFDFFRVSYPCCLYADDVTLDKTAVVEDQPSGTQIGRFKVARSSDFSVSLVEGAGGEDNALFTIRGDLLETNAIIQFEDRNPRSIRVRVDTADGKSVEKTFSIQVLHVQSVSSNILVLPLIIR